MCCCFWCDTRRIPPSGAPLIALRLIRLLPHVVLGLIGFVAVSAITLAWGKLHMERVSGLDSATFTAEIRLSPPEPLVQGQAQSLSVGFRELGQERVPQSAEDPHIQVHWDEAGQVFLQHVGTTRRLGLAFENLGGTITDLDVPLSHGDRFQIGELKYKVQISDDRDQLSLSSDQANRNDVSIPSDYFSPDEADIDWVSQSISIGGRVQHDPQLWGEGWTAITAIEVLLTRDPAPAIVVEATDLPANSIRIERRGNLNLLRGDGQRLVQVCPSSETQECFELSRQLWPVTGHPTLGDLRLIIAGRTFYSVALVDESDLLLKPVANGHWLRPDEIGPDGIDPRGVEITYASDGQASVRSMPPPDRGGPTPGSSLWLMVAGAIMGGFSSANLASVLCLLTAVMSAILIHFGSDREDRFTRLPIRIFIIPLLLGFGLAPGLETLPVVPRLDGLSVAGLIIAGTSIATFAVRVQFVGFKRLVAQNALLPWALFLLFISFGSVLYGLSDQPYIPGEGVTAAMLAIIALFWLTGILIIFGESRFVLLLFWLSLTTIVALATMSLFHLTFGQPLSRYIVLFERHLATMALIAATAAALASMRSERIAEINRLVIDVANRRIETRTGTYISFFLAFITVVMIGLSLAETLDYLPSLPIELPGFWNLFLSKGVLPFLLACLSFGLIFATHALSNVLPVLDSRGRRLSILFLAPAVILAGAVFVTPEGGIAGLQPSEAAKTGLAFYFALFIARFVDGNLWRLPFDEPQPLVIPLLSVLGLATAFVLGSAINFDLSPAAIIMVMTAALAAVLAGGVLFRLAPVTITAVLLVGLLTLALLNSSELGLLEVSIGTTIAIFLCAVGFAQENRSLAPFTPYGLRRLRHMPPNWLTKFQVWLRRYNGIWLVGVGGGIFTLAVVSVGALWFIGHFGTIEALSGYSFKIFGAINLPALPLERLLSFRDAQLPMATADGFSAIIYPDLSLQVRESREILAATGCAFRDGGSGPEWAINSDAIYQAASFVNICPFAEQWDVIFPSDGMLHPAILDMPAVQDDFAQTLLVASLGLDFGFLLLAAQVLFIGTAVAIGLRLSLLLGRKSIHSSSGLLSLVFLVGLLVIFVSQILLSWGNAFGLLPVVGQPMTFVSLGASHHLFFALPLVASVLVANAIAEALVQREREPRRIFTGARVTRYVPFA